VYRVALGLGLDHPRTVLQLGIPGQRGGNGYRSKPRQLNATPVKVEVPVGVGFKKVLAQHGPALLGDDAVVAPYAEPHFGGSAIAQAASALVLVGQVNALTESVGGREQAHA
jgi:hypothetical protein